MRIEYHPSVAEELEEIHHFYESRSPGLGDEFVNEFERQVMRIASMQSVGWSCGETSDDP